jgi:hypothetical protein
VILPDHRVDELLSAGHTKKGRTQRAIVKMLAEHEADGGLPTDGRFVGADYKQVTLAAWIPPSDCSKVTTQRAS